MRSNLFYQIQIISLFEYTRNLLKLRRINNSIYNGVRNRCVIKFKIWFRIPSRTNIKIAAFFKG